MSPHVYRALALARADDNERRAEAGRLAAGVRRPRHSAAIRAFLRRSPAAASAPPAPAAVRVRY